MEQSIGAAAQASGVKVTTIRFYEDRGLLPPAPRTATGRRVYGSSQIARLKFIKHARSLGFDLPAIQALLDLSDNPAQDCGAADSIARKQLQAVTDRIAQLRLLQTELDRMIRTCKGGAVSDCRVIETLADHVNCDTEHAFLPERDFRAGSN